MKEKRWNRERSERRKEGKSMKEEERICRKEREQGGKEEEKRT